MADTPAMTALRQVAATAVRILELVTAGRTADDLMRGSFATLATSAADAEAKVGDVDVGDDARARATFDEIAAHLRAIVSEADRVLDAWPNGDPGPAAHSVGEHAALLIAFVRAVDKQYP